MKHIVILDNKRYLVFGGFDASSNKELNVEFNGSNQLRVFLGTTGHDKKSGTIYANEDITVTFEWDANTKTYITTAKRTNTNITITNTVDIDSYHNPSGIAVNSLRIGTKDYRNTSSPFQPITVLNYDMSILE